MTADPNMRNLFLVFLLLFLLAGFAPLFQKFLTQIAGHLRSLDRPEGPDLAGVRTGQWEMATGQHLSPELYEFEAMVLARIAQADGKTLSFKALAGDLHLDPLLTKKTLASLGGRGFVLAARTVFGGRRFYLSAKGREYALGQGFLPRPQGGYGEKGG